MNQLSQLPPIAYFLFALTGSMILIAIIQAIRAFYQKKKRRQPDQDPHDPN